MSRRYRYFDIFVALFVSVLLISNVVSAAKIVNLGLPVLTFDAGTLLFPVSYIFSDVLTEVYGYRRARRVIWLGFFCAGLMSLSLGVVRFLPAEADWGVRVGQEAYDKVLGATPRVVAASLLAYFAGEFSNSYIMAKMKILTQGRLLFARTIGSTLVGEGVDTFLFVLIAFGGQIPPSVLFLVGVSNYFFKTSMETALTPLTYRIVNFLKKAEQEDYYDYDTDFNPFKVSLE
ncbi:MAG: queuosine precursor transporter [Anaerolineae bacterium]